MKELALMITLVFQMHGIPSEYGVCIAQAESRWDIGAVGNNGELGLWQWKDFSVEWALEDANIAWEEDRWGDPRLCPFASTVLAAHTMNRGYRHWWTTDKLCSELW